MLQKILHLSFLVLWVVSFFGCGATVVMKSFESSKTCTNEWDLGLLGTSCWAQTNNQRNGPASTYACSPTKQVLRTNWTSQDAFSGACTGTQSPTETFASGTCFRPQTLSVLCNPTCWYVRTQSPMWFWRPSKLRARLGKFVSTRRQLCRPPSTAFVTPILLSLTIIFWRAIRLQSPWF